MDCARRLKLEKQEDVPNTVIVYLGEVEGPFPAPLVKTSTGWKFDARQRSKKSRIVKSAETTGSHCCLPNLC
jgi:hypothetical protein